MFHSSSDRPVLPPYYVSNSKEIINGTTLIPRFGSGNLAPPVLQAAGQFRHLSLPPCLPLNQSLPPNYFSLNHQYRQPPLLPLPVSKPQSGSLLSGNLTTNAKTRSDPSFAHRKKSKKKPRNPGKEETLKSDNTLKVLSPRPGQVIKVSSSTSNPLLGVPKHQLPSNKVCVKEIDEQYDVVGIDKFSADRAVFTLSPPPSSLPLPTFSLRPKLRRAAPPAAGNLELRN